jgi:hypothetical protein
MGTSTPQVRRAGSPQKGEQTLLYDRPQREAVVVEDIDVSESHARVYSAERNYGRDFQYRAILLPRSQLQFGKDIL